jgi:hypothetical protein
MDGKTLSSVPLIQITGDCAQGADELDPHVLPLALYDASKNSANQ